MMLFASSRSRRRQLSAKARQSYSRDGVLASECSLEHLIAVYYPSIRDGASPPISYQETIVTARLMDSILDDIHDSLVQDEGSSPDLERPAKVPTSAGSE